ncbi:hypothetical protein DFJ58DRAFT_736692 [Suillus subalutaceus]|uniref:uncharacterized protein n=1 Tax=Suillus subalutaceus TaxID=48586 RepID=UPI001B862525|nr:uncharacterized protein DFJ58DRAFT_736692 [Suillus subalutaceus]KAG1831212.1 hypothetical protein DFJ58DRAFT_736692 [Suillus subalutaceus]
MTHQSPDQGGQTACHRPQAAQEANLQRGIDCIASIEAAMEVEQGIQVTAKVKPVKPRARPVKKKTDKVGAASELTSGSLSVPPAPAQSQGGIKGQDAGDLGEGDVEVVRNKVAKPPKKIKKVHEAIGATILGSDQRVKGTGGSVLSVTTLKTSQTAATTVSLAKDPPLSLMDSSGDSVSDNGEDGGNGKDGGNGEDRGNGEDGGNEEDRDGDDEYFEKHLSTDIKGKLGMKSIVQIAESSDDGFQQADIVRFALEQARQPRAVSSTKRTIEEAELIGSSKDNNQDDEEEEGGRRRREEEEEEFIIDPMLVYEESSSITRVPEKTHTTTKASLLENWAFLYEDLENRDPNKIYRSVFMIEMIESAHINATAGFLNVPALDTDTLQVKGIQAIIAASAAAVGHVC